MAGMLQLHFLHKCSLSLPGLIQPEIKFQGRYDATCWLLFYTNNLGLTVMSEGWSMFPTFAERLHYLSCSIRLMNNGKMGKRTKGKILNKETLFELE